MGAAFSQSIAEIRLRYDTAVSRIQLLAMTTHGGGTDMPLGQAEVAF